MRGPVRYLKLVAADTVQKILGNRGKFRDLSLETAMVRPSSLSPDVCRTLRSRIDQALASGESSRIWCDKVGADQRIFGFETDAGDLIDKFAIEDNIRGIEAYIGRRVRSWTLMANRITPKAENLGSGGGLHRDSPFSHQVKLIWYLSDVGEGNGPFQYVRGSHRDLIGQHGRYPVGSYRFDDVDEPLTSVHGPEGTLLICDTRCIHGGKPIENGARYAVTLYTFHEREGVRGFFASAGLDPAWLDGAKRQISGRFH